MADALENVKEKMAELMDRLLAFIAGQSYKVQVVKVRVPDPYRIAVLQRRLRNLPPSDSDRNRF